MRELMVGIECPNCRRKFEVKVRRTFVNSEKHCPHCRAIFEVVGNTARIIKQPSARASKAS